MFLHPKRRNLMLEAKADCYKSEITNKLIRNSNKSTLCTFSDSYPISYFFFDLTKNSQKIIHKIDKIRESLGIF